MEKEIFEKEINICREHYNKKKSCAWGECEKCGAIPLLHKLFKEEVVDNKDDVEELKREYLN